MKSQISLSNMAGEDTSHGGNTTHGMLLCQISSPDSYIFKPQIIHSIIPIR